MIASHRGATSRTSLDTASHASEHDDATPVTVLPSSTELFYFYGQTLEACATLSTRAPLFDLLEVFKKWLRVYAGMRTACVTYICLMNYAQRTSYQKPLEGWLLVKQRVPKLINRYRTGPIPRRSIDSRWDATEVKNACLVVNTADYCHNTAQEVCTILMSLMPANDG
jgi:vacuolar protein sorting-associated protein 53